MPAKKRASGSASKTNGLKKSTTGRPLIDELSINEKPLVNDYVAAVSDYVVNAASMTASQSKQAQIVLSSGLGRALSQELQDGLPRIKPHAGELNVAGALRNARADVSEAHPLDGLRLAVEIKPINLAVGRAIWNRFGDVRAFAVNIHLKFPFAVVGGVLAIPTWEWATPTKRMQAMMDSESTVKTASEDDAASTARPAIGDEDVAEEDEVRSLAGSEPVLYRKSTEDLIYRLIRRLTRTRRRETEADPAHLLEAIAVIVYDPDAGVIHPQLPEHGTGLRWSEFVSTLIDQYDVRFED